MYGILKKDILECNDRYPLDYGHVYTEDEVKSMFFVKYKKGTKLYRKKDDGFFAWYTKDGDDGWSEFYSLEDYFNGKKYHSVISNLELKNK